MEIDSNREWQRRGAQFVQGAIAMVLVTAAVWVALDWLCDLVGFTF